MLSSYLACPRQGHLENALHIIGYLRLKHNSRLIFDPTYPDIDQTAFPSFEWTEFYGNVEEAIPPDMPPPLGKDIDLCMMVDSDHGRKKKDSTLPYWVYHFLQFSPNHLAIKAARDY
jgi:hypothetical protein